MTPPNRKVAVLGAGLAGLACAYELARKGVPVKVFEKDSFPGGMAASFTYRAPWGEEFVYDFGPHRFHTKDDELRAHVEEILGENKLTAHRLSRIHLFGKFFDYPLKAKNVLTSLPPHLLVRAFLDYFWIRFKVRTGLARIPDDNFEDWVVKRFGKTLYRIFFGTYTAKAWGMSPRDISADWASQRITLLSLWDTVKKTLSRKKGNTPRTLVTEFLYPRTGGIGAIARAYVERIREAGGEVILGTPVTRIARAGSRVTTLHAEGESAGAFEVDRVLSTIPITSLVHLLDPPPGEEVLEACSNLRYIGIVFVYLVLDKPSVSPDSWIYLPEKHLTVHRISEFRNFSPGNAPPGKTMICTEITCRKGDDVWNMDEESAIQVAVKDMETVGLVKKEEVLEGFVRKMTHAYPVYDLHYKENLAPLRAFLAGLENLETGGRQGLFRYNNMDQSVEMGRRMAWAHLEGRDAGHAGVATGREYFG